MTSKNNKIKIVLSNIINYDNCLEKLQQFYDLYEWETEESKIKSRDSLKYYALLMNQWINGISLNQIINESIRWNDLNSYKFYINHKNVGKFNKEDKDHINELINKIIEDIEQILRFVFEKYFNHYYGILKELLGDEKAGPNWAQYLEYGTQNRIIIALQNLGLSRHSATFIYNNYRNCLIIEENKLKGIHKNDLILNIDKDSIEYEEIVNVL